MNALAEAIKQLGESLVYVAAETGLRAWHVFVLLLAIVLAWGWCRSRNKD